MAKFTRAPFPYSHCVTRQTSKAERTLAAHQAEHMWDYAQALLYRFPCRCALPPWTPPSELLYTPFLAGHRSFPVWFQLGRPGRRSRLPHPPRSPR